MTEYKVITEGNANEVWASGFHGDYGRKKAWRMIDEGYWHRLMHPADKGKKLVVIPARQS